MNDDSARSRVAESGHKDDLGAKVLEDDGRGQRYAPVISVASELEVQEPGPGAVVSRKPGSPAHSLKASQLAAGRDPPSPAGHHRRARSDQQASKRMRANPRVATRSSRFHGAPVPRWHT